MTARTVLRGGFLGFELPGAVAWPGVRHVFAARQPATGAGNLSLSGDRDRASALAARAQWSEHLGVSPADWTCCALEHGARVRVVGAADRGRGADDPAQVLPAADGIITATPGLALYLPVADCAAVLMLRGGPRARLGVFHAGWRGLAAGVLREGVRRMREGAAEAPVLAAISPCARAPSYEVGAEVAALAPPAAVHRDGARRSVDVGAWCVAELRAAGLPAEAITDCGVDTLSDARCFSHRAHGAGAGRNALIAVLA